MIVIVSALLAAAAVSVGLRTLTGFLERVSHPMDRLAIAILGGVVMVALALGVSARLRVLEAGLGLIVSLSPVGIYDFAKWWYQSRERRTPWLVGAGDPAWVVALRWLWVVGVALTCVTVAVIARSAVTTQQ